MERSKIRKLLSVLRPDIFLVMIIAFTAGYFIRSLVSNGNAIARGVSAPIGQMWTCSMDPQVQKTGPGQCPICEMDLIPVGGDDDGQLGAGQISFSPDALKLMEVETTRVERKFVEAVIHMAGKIDYDETRLEDVTAWVGGRIDRMYVDFTGTRVIKGDHMFNLYSPALISAQGEFLQSLKAFRDLNPSTSKLLRDSIEATHKSSKEKLRLLGLRGHQIQ